jgi:tetratricopeptide (TPR) repeat protein
MPQQSKAKPTCLTASPLRAASITKRTDHASPPVVEPHSGWGNVVVCILLALVVWAVFGQTRHFEFVNFDDGRLIYENAAIIHGLSWDGVIKAFTHINADEWWPLTTLSHMLDCQLYGLEPGGHHLTNVLLHAATAILLFLVFRNLTGAFWPSAFVAAVFAVHPLRVESVAWVTERKDVLSGLFFVLTLGAYARYVRRSEVRSLTSGLDHLPSSNFYLLSLFFFALGLLSKTMLVTLPFVLLLLDYWPLRRVTSDGWRVTGIIWRRLIIEKLPFLLLSAAACAATILAQKGTIQTGLDLGFSARIGNAVVSYASYLGQMVYPFGLAVFYPHPGNQLSGETVFWCLVILLLISGGVMRWQRVRPYLLVGWLWYLGMLVPVIGFLQVGIQARADRYTYLPQLGLYIMVAWGAVDLCRNWRWRRVVLPTAATLILTGLMFLAHVQTGYWRDSVSLWSHTLDCTSGNFLAHHTLGSALATQGKSDEAIPHYVAALRINPDYPDTHYNLGVALTRLGKRNEAVQHYERALQLKPDYAQAHNNLGLELAAQGKAAEARRHFEQALQFKPDYADAHHNLGFALFTHGKVNEAIPYYERALQLNPGDAETHEHLGLAYGRVGRIAEAEQEFRRVLQLKPEARTHLNLGRSLLQQGKPQAAAVEYEAAVRLSPDLPMALNDLAWLRATHPTATLRDGEQAVRLAERACALNPEDARCWDTLAAAYAEAGRFEDAIRSVAKARQLAQAAGQTNLVATIEQVSVLYQKHQPFRQQNH